MIDRRELFGAAALAAAPLTLSAGAWARGTAAAPAVALYDARYDEAHRFAAALAGSGALELETGRDLASLWYGRLRRTALAWPGLRIAGLATCADFQVIAGCAAESRLKLVHHAVHDGRGGASHRVLRGSLAAPLSAAGPAWPEALAAALAGAPPPAPAPASRSGEAYPGTLVSWMIT
jgi:hypothetical protein